MPTSERGLHELLEEQAALRRVATLVANGAEPAEVFSAVANELAQLIGADATFVTRIEPINETVTECAEIADDESESASACIVLSSYGRAGTVVTPGFRAALQPATAMAAALRTGRAARLTGETLTSGPFAEMVRQFGLRAAVATPVVVNGRCWGATVAATEQSDFPPSAESRMADFTELAATAIANAQAEEHLHKLADTQAALRRLAMLVARGEPPEAVFAAVTKEVLHYFGRGTARMIRYEPDGTATLIANEGATGEHVRIGKPWVDYPATGLTAHVRETGRPARVDDYRAINGGEPSLREGINSAVGVPIVVHGKLWGLIAVGSGDGPLPAGTEQRMTEFTDLVATAIATAQSRAELMSSRARIVTASDEVRRRIERDLHDGAQQRLVMLGLKLRSAVTETPPELAEMRSEILDVADGLMGVLDELREIARGIHPAILSEAGLRPALGALARRSLIPVELHLRVNARLPEPVEVAAYYVVSETLTNAARHADASVVEITAEQVGGRLQVCVADDGVGGADLARGSGLVGLKDRVEAIGGTFAIESPDGGGTAVSCSIPLEPRTALG
jgi:signal transduction histidine kinase